MTSGYTIACAFGGGQFSKHSLYSAAVTTDDATSRGSGLAPKSGSDSAGYELVIFSGETVRTFQLPREGTVTIGREPDSDVCIDDSAVSREHALLRVGKELELEDLGGANGTFLRERGSAGGGNETLNIRQLRRRKARIAVGDTMLFGTASVVVRHVANVPSIALPEPNVDSHGAGVVVQDAAMRELYAQAARAARSSISVLLFGETGVGKEVLARAIHAHSPRSAAPFMGINCAALSESLLESELFGSEKGAFTGAVQARAGLFEASHGGTVFLDEVGELPLATQAKLLRVLEERVVTRLGSTRPRPIDVRFVSATNRDIETEGLSGGFRRDLFFRLNGISLTIPPLRERPAEVELFARKFLAAACVELELPEKLELSPEALESLRGHGWPGNVRELRNAIERAAVLCPGKTILPEHLPPSLLRRPTSASSVPSDGAAQLPGEIRTLERTRIIEVLESCNGNQTKAAELLGISRRTLVSRLGEFGLPRPRKRDGAS
jgi:two-component system, NtrC family, response regulator AtoC